MRLTEDKISCDSKTLYHRDMSRYPILTEDQELGLVKKVQAGDKNAMDVLVTANLRFVISVVRRYNNCGLSYMDLINEGNFGLIKAAKKFDSEKRVKFISYAVWWIRQAIQKAIFEQSGTVRIPVNKLAEYRKFNKILELNSGDYYSTLKSREFNEFNVTDTMKKMKSISIHATIGSAEKEMTLEDTLGNRPNQDEDMERNELSKGLEEVLLDLPSRDEQVLRMFYGIGFKENFTLLEIGKQLHMSRERVRIIKNRALRRVVKSSLFKSRFERQDSLSIVIS